MIPLSPLAARLLKELREETGFRAGRYERLGSFYPAPSWSTEFDYLYLATH